LFSRLFKNRLKLNIDLFELLNGAFSNFIIQLLGILFGYLVIFLISHFYGSKGLGIFTLTFAVANVFILVGKGGFDTSIVKFISEGIKSDKHNIKSTYTYILLMCTPLNILLTLAMFMLSPFIANHLFKNNDLIPFLQIMSFVILPISLRSINANAFRGFQKIKTYSILQNVLIHFFFILGILIINAYVNEIKYLLFSYLLSSWIVFIISNRIWFEHIKSEVGGATSQTIKSILKISTPMLVTSSLMLVITWSDSLMLGYFCTEEDVGVYSVAMKISTSSLIVFMAFNSILAPKVAKFYSHYEFVLLNSLVKSTRRLVIYISIPSSILLIIVTPYLLNLFGEDFDASYSPFLILMIGMIIKNILGVSECVLQMTNKQKSVAYISFLGVIFNVFLNVYFIPLYGVDGAAIASTISVVSMQILFYIKDSSRRNK
jgi:O-antigen/teichoic acid export membrane protein